MKHSSFTKVWILAFGWRSRDQLSHWRPYPHLPEFSSVSQWKTSGPYLHQRAFCRKTISDEHTVSMRRRQDSIDFTRCADLEEKEWTSGITRHWMVERDNQTRFKVFISPHLYRWKYSHVWWNQSAFGWSCSINSHPLTLVFQKGRGWGRAEGGCDERFMSSGGVRTKIGVLCQCYWKGWCNQMSPTINKHANHIHMHQYT